jgi:predicted dehydrogenase
MKNFKAGIVGIGFIGVAHIEALRRLGNVDVIAIADANDAHIKASNLNIPHGFKDYREMIDSIDLDTIHICTPNNTHYEIAMYAMSKGINVVCEKPFTTSIEEAKSLVKVAKEKRLINAMNFHNRFYPLTNHLKQIIKNGDLGDVFSIHGGYIQDWLLYDTDFNWRLISTQSGKTRAVADIGSHWFDLIEYITGLEISEVFAEFGTFHKTRKCPVLPTETFSKVKLSNEEYKLIKIDTEDFACVMLRFKNGAIGNATISQMFAGKKNKISVFVGGSKMSAQWDSDDTNNLILGRRNEPNLILNKDPKILSAHAADLASYPGGHVEGFADAIKQVFKQVYASIEKPNNSYDYATFEDGLRQMLICDKIYESSQTRKWVSL